MSFQVMLEKLAGGFGQTCLIFALTLVISLPVGMIVYFGRVCRFKPVSWLVKIFISIMRGTPLMLQLLVVYFGPYFIFGMRLTPNSQNVAVVIGFMLNYAAYFAEIYRSGIESMPAGQYEAAAVLGYSKSQTFFHIILPQVIKRILPSLTNEVINLVKDTTLAFSIGVMELFTRSKELAAAWANVIPYVGAGVFYYIFNYVVAWIMERFEKKLSYYK